MKTDLVELKNSKDKTYVVIYYDTFLHATVDEWVGDFESKRNFIAGLDQVLINILKNGSKKWLADLTKIEGDFSDMKDYIIKFIIPEARKAGLQYEALVLPFNILGILAVQTTLLEFEGIEIQIFPSVDQASAWLNSK
jgi:hypothetical protein